jgi:hypothetical protein
VPRSRWQLLIAASVLVYVALAVVYLDFATVDSCIDAGGVLRDGACVFAREGFTPLLSRGWGIVTINLALPAIPALGFACLVWLAWGRRKPGVQQSFKRTPQMCIVKANRCRGAAQLK